MVWTGLSETMENHHPKRKVESEAFPSKAWFLKGLLTLQETNISPKNGILKMIFLFPRWDMLIPWRVIKAYSACLSVSSMGCVFLALAGHQEEWQQSGAHLEKYRNRDGLGVSPQLLALLSFTSVHAKKYRESILILPILCLVGMIFCRKISWKSGIPEYEQEQPQARISCTSSDSCVAYPPEV